MLKELDKIENILTGALQRIPSDIDAKTNRLEYLNSKIDELENAEPDDFENEEENDGQAVASACTDEAKLVAFEEEANTLEEELNGLETAQEQLSDLQAKLSEFREIMDEIPEGILKEITLNNKTNSGAGMPPSPFVGHFAEAAAKVAHFVKVTEECAPSRAYVGAESQPQSETPDDILYGEI